MKPDQPIPAYQPSAREAEWVEAAFRQDSAIVDADAVAGAET